MARVDAIVRLKALEAHRTRQGVPLETNFEHAMESFLGARGVRRAARTSAPSTSAQARRRRREAFLGTRFVPLDAPVPEHDEPGTPPSATAAASDRPAPTRPETASRQRVSLVP